MPVCRFCGDRFSGRSDARYCSDACRQAAYRKRKRNAVTDGGACSVAVAGPDGVLSVTDGALPLKPKPHVLGDPVRVVVSFTNRRGWREVG
jgi:hypothetical protein